MWKLTTTDDGQRMITIVHLSFRLRFPKNEEATEEFDYTAVYEDRFE